VALVVRSAFESISPMELWLLRHASTKIGRLVGVTAATFAPEVLLAIQDVYNLRSTRQERRVLVVSLLQEKGSLSE